ncbi:arsenate reductase (glutaredoxin) [Enterovirga rhinocerotis]|uniref:Arsenate reductase n=1 Tax=Enterovirga rhinocerotis TaxID=1339210 RepID=A0A4R7C5B1_9HYPH|nr:arsenate reductase (glutaredoxin) [Enterovirga rhinocerotis]TDR93072.1 arsenate reductase [Enterovirga rhinocerotis]
MNVTIYHNPACGTSRNALAMLERADVDLTVVPYLTKPPTKERLRELSHLSGLTVREMIREKGTPFKELGLDQPSVDEEALLDAMVANPILINRPFVVTPTQAKLCRPSETVLDLLRDWPRQNFNKDDGTPFLEVVPIPGSDDDLHDALVNANLPVDDIEESSRTFFRFQLLDGLVVGYGGYEIHGRDALLRSVCRTEWSAKGIGPSLVQLLLSRAFDDGARRAFVLTEGAAPFFRKIGFNDVDRATAPEAIRSTRQALELCPASAALLSRAITL